MPFPFDTPSKWYRLTLAVGAVRVASRVKAPQMRGQCFMRKNGVWPISQQSYGLGNRYIEGVSRLAAIAISFLKGQAVSLDSVTLFSTARFPVLEDF